MNTINALHSETSYDVKAHVLVRVAPQCFYKSTIETIVCQDSVIQNLSAFHLSCFLNCNREVLGSPSPSCLPPFKPKMFILVLPLKALDFKWCRFLIRVYAGSQEERDYRNTELAIRTNAG